MNYGTIRISTNPSGATVYVHDQGNKGATPIDIVNVMPGIYNITLSYPGLNSYNFDTVVIDSNMTIVRFDFIVQEVTEEHIVLTGTDLVPVPVPPGLPEEEPPGLPPGMPTEQPQGISLQKVENLLEKIYSNLNTSLQYTSKLSGFDTSERYFAQDSTAITTATPNQPESAEVVVTDCQGNLIPGATSGYDRICVNQVLNRNARTITVNNDGTRTLYVISSSNGQTWNNVEIPILQGEYKRFFNVYELRIRSSKVGVLDHNIVIGGNVITVVSYGGIYRVTEYETENALYNVNRTSTFITSFPNVPVVGIGIVTFVITGDMINTTVAFRASVTNTNVIYATYASGLTTTDTQRIILNPGDVFKVNITKGASMRFSGAVAGQRMEMLQESDLT